ncbi:pseudouridine synthase [Uliginosibacterium sp. H1]|uniref:pseudouridine synthase n=1 Tax=Uliginosibacterium sp. H1 TaxID=3114757 RepID=UPI002E196308|nr:pseudouridine synthase [Uliginosibacterium sp. H1]
MSVRVIARHDGLIVFAKPAGMSFHAEEGEGGFMAAARAASGVDGLHAVHRLDRITSGLVLCATGADAARDLSAQFANGEVEKYYLALSARKPSKTQGWVKGRMEKGRGGNWRLAAGQGQVQGQGQGPYAVTQFFSYGLGEGLGRRLFVVRPRTGRTHQIRVALKSLGSPILGDARYGGAAADRGYLHAWALRLAWRGESLNWTLLPDEGSAFLDATLQARLQEVGAPWQLAWPSWQMPERLATPAAADTDSAA